MNIAIILAAGSGTRMQNGLGPKQFIEVDGKPLLVHTILAFETHRKVDTILVVTSDEYIDQVKLYCKQFNLSKVRSVVKGGKTRQISVFNGLEEVATFAESEDIVLIHDAARPLVTEKIITDNIEGALVYHAIDTAIPAVDTIVASKDGKTIDAIPSRESLYLGQTPQTFSFKLIYDAHIAAKNSGTTEASDDCQLAYRFGADVHLVSGSAQNFKITTNEDLKKYELVIKSGDIEK